MEVGLVIYVSEGMTGWIREGRIGYISEDDWDSGCTVGRNGGICEVMSC